MEIYIIDISWLLFFFAHGQYTTVFLGPYPLDINLISGSLDLFYQILIKVEVLLLFPEAKWCHWEMNVCTNSFLSNSSLSDTFPERISPISYCHLVISTQSTFWYQVVCRRHDTQFHPSQRVTGE